MLKVINRLLPDSFRKRILILFILFAVATGAISISIQYIYDKQMFRHYASETIINIHKSVQNRLKDSILFDDIYTFSVWQRISLAVSH